MALAACQRQPVGSGKQILLHTTQALLVNQSEVALGFGVARFGGLGEPQHRFRIICLRAQAIGELDAQVILRRHVAQLGSTPGPCQGLFQVDRDAQTLFVHHGQLRLGGGNIELGCPRHQFCGLVGVFTDAIAAQEQQAQVVEADGFILLGGEFIPFGGLTKILGHAQAFFKHPAHLGLRLGVPRCGSQLVITQGHLHGLHGIGHDGTGGQRRRGLKGEQQGQSTKFHGVSYRIKGISRHSGGNPPGRRSRMRPAGRSCARV